MSTIANDVEQEVLKIFDAAETPVLTTQDVADRLGVSRRTALRRLTDLEEDDVVGRKEAGPRAAVWWANKAPELAPHVADRVEESKERGEFVALDDV
jgi:predicted ArsR family transcriptional regulator